MQRVAWIQLELAPRTPQGDNYSESGDNTAAFNRVSSFLIKTDLVSGGIPVNSLADSVIAEVLINAKPGSLINYAPTNPPTVNAMELASHSKNSFSFRLTDQLGRPAQTLGESYSLLIMFRYTVEV